MGWREEAIKYHDKLTVAVIPFKESVLTKADITKILIQKFPELTEKADWILPSDHCINHTNRGACYCALTDEAIFERVGWGRYRVL